MKKTNCLLAAAILGLTLLACQKEEGPAEKAGKEADKAMKQAGQAMEKAADSVKEATKGK
jgi:TRAP-type C4-dicarboxylate transport system substrate-binding protein